MVTVKNEGIVLEKTEQKFENNGVLNPACVLTDDGITHMFYRAVQKGNFSTIGYCELINNRVVKRDKQPFLIPEYDFEKHGLEDPRIVKSGATYYLFYTAFDGINAMIAYATSSDLKSFQKHGVISPRIKYDKAIEIFKKQGLKESYETCKGYCEIVGIKNIQLWDKDAFIFPKKIGGNFALVHRILPEIEIVYIDNLDHLTEKYWEGYLPQLNKYVLLEQRYPFENGFVGGGCPPIETPQGWLMLYHGAQAGAGGLIYHASAVLLDLQNPQKVLGRLKNPLFSPVEAWEKIGVVNNVVFPTAAVVHGERLFIYYGAADHLIACKSINMKELINELLKNP